MDALGTDRATLGESPLWHAGEGRFFWVDIVGETVFCLIEGVPEVVHRGLMVTALSERADGGLIMVSGDGVLTWAEGEVTKLTGLDLPERVRPNDGKCDPVGRLWFGTMDLEATNPIGGLYTYDGLSVRLVESGIVLSNGLGWGPNGDVFYHTDSSRRHIYRYDYDLGSGSATNRTLLVDFGDVTEVPDGLAVDVDGNLWVAMYDGWRLQVISPAGHTIHIESLDVQKPTSLAFAGDGLAQLYVTTASQDLDPEELDRQPHAGRLLRFDPGARGVPVGHFAAAR
jgi:sugar lactone lactonase YvrE